jgi:hypothetical protein
MIEWFDDLAVGMRFKTGEVTVTTEDIKRFAADFDRDGLIARLAFSGDSVGPPQVSVDGYVTFS